MLRQILDMFITNNRCWRSGAQALFSRLILLCSGIAFTIFVANDVLKGDI